MMYKVLLAVGNDDAVARTVNAILSLPGEADEYEVTVLNIFEAFEVMDEGINVSSKEFYREEDIPENVLAIRDQLADAGVSVTVRRTHGDPTEKILNIAAELDVNAIAVGGRKRSPVGKAVFGSVLQGVMLNADRPVVTMREEEAG